MKKVMRWLSLIIIGAVLIVQGCKSVGPEFKMPEVETPQAFLHTMDGTKAVEDLKWWELFNDPLLRELTTMALENNRDLLTAMSRIEQARATYGYTKADQYPSVDIEGGGSTGNWSGARSEYMNSTVYIAPMLSWEIDLWGRYRRATAAAMADLAASEYEVRSVQIQLIADVASAYYQLLDYHRRLDIAKDTLASRMDGLEIIEKRFERGIIPEIDLNQAQIQKEIASGSIPRYQRAIAKMEQVLNLLIGRLPEGIAVAKGMTEQAPPFIPSAMPSTLLERRPDLQQALATLKAENERIGVAVAQRFPAISLTGGLGLASSELSDFANQGEIWSTGASLLGPLFDWNKSKRNVEVQEAVARQALLSYEQKVLTAFGEVEDALVEVDTYSREMASTARKVAAAQNAAELSFKRYEKGVSSYLEVLDSERTLFDVELELSEMKQLYFNAYVKLYQALGGGWISEAGTGDSGAAISEEKISD